jgi:hypothetical protein
MRIENATLQGGRIRRNSLWIAAALAIAAALPLAVPAQAPANLAGKITRLLPVDFVIRQQKQLEAKKDMEVLWGDTIRTERGGRVRVELGDGSVLNVGSQSSLVIEKHDAEGQDTALELVYGRVRANAVKIARPDGGFKVRTKAAVAGVVGTEKYLEATDINTLIIALGGGQVIVTSTDPRFPDPVVLNPGETVTMTVARPPGRKRAATTEELNKAVRDTEADPVASLGTRQAAPGSNFDTFISGRGLGSATAITTSHPGITVQTRGGGSAAQIPISIVVAPDVPTGTYTITVERPEGPARATLVVQAGQVTQVTGAPPSTDVIQMPSPSNYSVIRGTKFTVDSAQVRAPAGSQIVNYQWAVVTPQGQVVNQTLRSSGAEFIVNTSLLPAGNYNVQLVVTSDRGATGTVQHPLAVQAGIQPNQIVADLAVAYESLQPAQFLRNFDEEKFRNYAGFAAAVEDSFRNKLQSMRVFQRPVNCAVIEEQDQAQCQAEFELQFSLKGDSTLRMGAESNTIRFERADAGWKIVDYSAVVSCPGGTATSGINVGSCVFATASTTAPSFQIFNLQVLTTDLLFGGSVPGSFDVVPTGGFNGNIQFTATGAVGNQSVSVQFSPNPSGPADHVNFTIFSPTTAPSNFSGPLAFTLTITGQDGSGSVTASVSIPMTLQPDFSLQVSPTTSSSAPAPVTHNSVLQVTAEVIPGAGFTGSVFVDFPNLPAGFLATGGSVSTGTPTVFPVQVTAAAAPGPAQIILRATFGTGIVKTATVFADVVSDFSLSVTPATSPANPLQVRAGGSAPITAQVAVISGFAGTVLIDFPSPPAGVTVVPANANVAAGAAMQFDVQLAAGGPLGPAQLTVRGTFAGSVQLATVFLNLAPVAPPVQSGAVRIAATSDGSFSLSASSASTQESPAVLTEAETEALVKVAVQADPNFSGVVQLSLTDIPEGIAAAVEPAEFELASGALEVVQVRFRAANPSALNAGQPFAVRLIAASGTRTVEMRVFVRAALKSPTSANPSPGSPRRPGNVDASPGRPVRRPPALDTQREASSAFPDPPARPADSPSAPAKTQSEESARRVAPRGSAAQRLERAQIQFAAGGCSGFRFASGTQTPCGQGADIELKISPEGNSITVSAEGVRNLGALTLERAAAVPDGPFGTSEALQAGATYAVQSRAGMIVVRVSRVTGLGARNAPPRAMRTPRVGAEEPGASTLRETTVFVEWKALPQ